jgi:hypothetical protein
MRAQPPKLATALLNSLLPGNDALTGDLAETYAQGRSRSWYWRQVVGAIFAASAREISTKPVAITRGLLIGCIVAWGFSNYVARIALDLDKWLFVRGFSWLYLHGYRLHFDPWMVAACCNVIGGYLAVRYYKGSRPVMALVYSGTILSANVILFALWVYHLETTVPPSHVNVANFTFVLSAYPGPLAQLLQTATTAFGVMPAAALAGGLWAAGTKSSLAGRLHA